MKKYWDIFTDRYGKSIFHPQFIMHTLAWKGVETASKLGKNKKLVDIGCGRMSYKEFLLRSVFSYTGVDHPKISKLYKAKEKVDVYASADKLPFDSGSFGVATMFQVLEYLPSPQEAINESARVLKQGGVLIITSPFMYPIHDGKYDRSRFTGSQISTFLKSANLKVVKVVQQGSFIEFWIQSLLAYLLKTANTLLSKNTVNIFLGALLLFFSLLITIPLNIMVVMLKSSSTKNTVFPLNVLAVAKKIKS